MQPGDHQLWTFSSQCAYCPCSLTVRGEDETIQRSVCERRTEITINCDERYRPPRPLLPHTDNHTPRLEHAGGENRITNLRCVFFFFLPFAPVSPRPTLEEARSWSTSFEKVMKSAAGCSCFRQFLRTEFSEENMMFWLACEELQKETNKTVVEEKVRQIYEDFISILSPKEVSRRRAVADTRSSLTEKLNTSSFCFLSPECL